MIFIGLGKLKIKPNKETAGQATNVMEQLKNTGIKIMSIYWTLGRYDTVVIFEAANEKEAFKTSLALADFVASETLVAIPREEALKLLS